MEIPVATLLAYGKVTTRKWCPNCEMETEHEIKTGDGCVAKICIPCRVRNFIREQTRD